MRIQVTLIATCIFATTGFSASTTKADSGTKNEPGADAESSSKAESYSPLTGTPPQLLSLFPRGVYPPGLISPVHQPRLEISQSHHLYPANYMHQQTSEIGHNEHKSKSKGKTGKSLSHSSQSKTARSHTPLGLSSKVKKGYYDKESSRSKGKSLHSDSHGLSGVLNFNHNQGIYTDGYNGHYFPQVFPFGHLNHYGNSFVLPHTPHLNLFHPPINPRFPTPSYPQHYAHTAFLNPYPLGTSHLPTTIGYPEGRILNHKNVHGLTHEHKLGIHGTGQIYGDVHRHFHLPSLKGSPGGLGYGAQHLTGNG